MFDTSVLNAEPVLEGDFGDLQSMAVECGPSSVLGESGELYDGKDVNADAQHEDDFS